MKLENSSVYVFNVHLEAQAAILLLSDAAFDMQQLSLIGKGYHSEKTPVGFYATGDRIKTWGGIGAFWGGIWGVLQPPALIFFPGLGLIALAGPVDSALVGALDSAVMVGGLSALGGAMTRIGISPTHAIKYETALMADKYVLIVHGSVDDVAKARAVLTLTPGWQNA